ncbi:MAG: hypothetical protein ACRDNY_01075 [Gaiellaceae bacterium]
MARPRAAAWGPTLALVAAVAVSFVTYSALAWNVPSPRVFSDELLYFDAAAAVVEGDGLTVRGDSYRYGPVYPALLSAILWIAPDRELAYQLAKTLNALLFALSAVPIFLLARRILPPWPSAVAAALSVAIPSAMYVSVVMTESLAYLAVSWALYAIVLALERPTAARQFVALLAILLAAGVRSQFLSLAGAYVLGLALVMLLVPGRRAAPRRLVVSLWPTAVSLAVGVAVLLLPSVLGSERSPEPLGAYSTLWRSYNLDDVAFWLVRQLANLELYVAVVPVAVAPIVLASLVAAGRRGSEPHAAFVSLFVAVNVALLAPSAAFNSTEWALGLFHDRTAFYVVPLWLIVLFVWIFEGAPRPLLAAATGAALALALPLSLPFSSYASDDVQQQFGAVATTLWVGIDEAAAGVGISGRVILMLFVALLVTAALALPPRRSRLLVAGVFAVFLVTAELSWYRAAQVAEPWVSAVPPVDRSWLDERVAPDRSVTLLTAISRCTGRATRDAFYLSEFFNSSVARVAHLGASPDWLPPRNVRVLRDGQLRAASGGPLVADYVVTQPGVRLDGRRVAEATAARLVLWEVAGPVRALGVSSAQELRARTCNARRLVSAEQS